MNKVAKQSQKISTIFVVSLYVLFFFQGVQLMHDCHLIVSIGAGLYFFLQLCSNPDKIFQIGTGLRLDFKHWGFP